MPSAYSVKYRLELPAFGEKINVWGPIVNSNFGTLLEQAIDGYVGIAMPDANLTLSTVNAGEDQARNKMFKFSGALSAAREVILPATSRSLMMWNATTQSLMYKTAGGAGVTLPPGSRAWVLCDGLDTFELGNYARLTGGSVTGMTSVSATEVLRGTNNLADFSQNVIVANYTLTDSDRHRCIYRTGAAACELTLPPNAAVALPLGTLILVAVETAASDMTVAPAVGVTLRRAGSTAAGPIVLAARSAVWLIKVGINEWFLVPTPVDASSGALFAVNNLSDVANVSSSRTNLGLGTAAIRNIGNSGQNVPLLDGSNTHTDARGVAAPTTSDLQFGFRRLRAASITSGTVVVEDSDSCVYALGNVTIPNLIFSQGDCLLIYNNTAAPIVITQGAGLGMRLDGQGSFGNRTLAARGRASILFVSATEAVIGGAVT